MSLPHFFEAKIATCNVKNICNRGNREVMLSIYFEPKINSQLLTTWYRNETVEKYKPVKSARDGYDQLYNHAVEVRKREIIVSWEIPCMICANL